MPTTNLRELGKRALFGTLMAAVALGSLVAGGPFFAAFIGLAALAGVREWHRIVEGGRFVPEAAVGGGSIVVAMTGIALWPAALWPWAALAGGVAGAGVVAAIRRSAILWHAAGPLYLGLAALSVVALREGAAGGWLVFGLFIAVWAADTGALVSGRLIGGPKLVPVLSPNKTWAGFVGGIGFAAGIEAVFVWSLGGDPLAGGGLGAGLALVAHLGDLFESWAKRIHDLKNSGTLIPGHGGVLDRIDSMLFAAPVFAALVLLLDMDPLFGAVL